MKSDYKKGISKAIYYLGIDIGSVSINLVVVDHEQNIIDNRYIYCQGRPFLTLRNSFTELLKTYPAEQIAKIAYTGTGGKLASGMTGGSFVNEIIAQSTAVAKYHPEVKTIIEMGGEDSKLIFMSREGEEKSSSLSDFSMNSLCAAGTGSFLDQQASRIGVSIENEFGELALQSEKPPRIAGRCSVFAKSDMIHLQQIATPVHDIVAGLCFAVARNLKSTLGRGKQLEAPVIFNGGVAANKGMVRAFREILELPEDDFIISPYHASMGALGAILYTLQQNTDHCSFHGIEKITEYLESDLRSKTFLSRLTDPNIELNKDVFPIADDIDNPDVYLGIDVGSLSTNVVLIDKDNNVIARRYLPTASKPLEAIKKGISEIYEEIGERVQVKAAGTTGSGRYLTGDFIGADTIVNEITAQATAAIIHDPTVDTIFEIGGQDSKYIRIQNGVVVDFEMNKVCAAGTGSFLEEQAEKLGISIVGEFGKLAMESSCPSKLGDRCTVFMESDLNSHSQKGEIVENLVGGLAYSIVHNYLNRVVGNKIVGNRIFFQGGVTNNKAVVAAFEQVTGKSITVPPHFDVTGAIGAAILAREAMVEGQQTRFKGFDVRNRSFSTDNFVCKHCNNLCEIRRVKIEGEERPYFYGHRCERYDMEERKGKGNNIPNYLEERIALLTEGYDPDKNQGKTVIGLPRALLVYYQQFPFWRTYFEELNFRVMVSDNTSHDIITRSLECMVAETCYPVEVMHGHILDLYDKGADFVFTPFIVNAKGEENNPTYNCNCPWIQSYSYMTGAAFNDKQDLLAKMLSPVLHFRFPKTAQKELSGFMKDKFRIKKSDSNRALEKAYSAQAQFENRLRERGTEILEKLPDDKQALILIGRPYNLGDPSMNLNLVEKLIRMDTIPIPLDFLPLNEEYIFDEYRNMYWPNGQKMVSAARIISRDKRLFGVYLGNFRCGPDSFLQHFVASELKGKPFLHLEVDEHSADAGMITRIEAFLDSLSGYKKQDAEKETKAASMRFDTPDHKRKLYFPYMNDAAQLIAAACRYNGLDADVLPMQTEEDIELARKHTIGSECYPMICTTGSFLRKLMEPGVDPASVSFFMPDHNGPCRFGEYNKLQMQIFERLGYHDVSIISPTNENAYAEMPVKSPQKWRFLSWKAFVAMDLLRKLLQEKRPYEAKKGRSNEVYQKYVHELTMDIEKGGKKLGSILKAAADEFDNIPVSITEQKPVIAVVGEIFMRDNPFCSGHLVERLEEMGAETLMMPMSEWFLYSTYRYIRDSRWKNDIKGFFKAHIQRIGQNISAGMVSRPVRNRTNKCGHTHLHDILQHCHPYIHKHYDGDPPLSLGNAVILAGRHISGIANILPFSCMPGTIIASVSENFRQDHHYIPWLNIAFDGQEDTALDSRLQAFMHQAQEYKEKKKQREMEKV